MPRKVGGGREGLRFFCYHDCMALCMACDSYGAVVRTSLVS